MNFATTNLARSVDFYSTLLNARPKKLFADYALFITDQPALELALDAVNFPVRLSGDHYGIFVETGEEVEHAIKRLQDAGLAASVEREQSCCYASQTKVWGTDPEGRRWEVYTVHEDTDERNGPGMTCCQNDNETRSCRIEPLE